MAWLVRSGEVLAAAEVVRGRRERVRGLLGRHGLDGALVIPKCRQVHTMGMRFTIDVAFCDEGGVVLRTVSLRPWRVSSIVWQAAFAIEAEGGAFERWRLTLGDLIELEGADEVSE
jgi:uncharacterized protein